MDDLRIVAQRLPLDDIPDASLAHVYRLWCDRRRDRKMPAPGDMLPEEFGVALGKINLLDVLRDPLRFVFRVRGTVIASLHNSSLTGRDVREIEPAPYRDMLLEHYAEAATAGEPTLYHIKQNREAIWNEYRRLILPLGGPARVDPRANIYDGGRISGRLGGTVERLLTASAWGPEFVERARELGFK